VENAYLRPLVSFQNAAISWQSLHLSQLNMGKIWLEIPLNGIYKGAVSTCLLVEFPLPKGAVPFLVVDYD
jgi:hypothetical protein